MAPQDSNQDPQDRNLEEPGDTNAHDIVGRTGEQMPRQSHDGVVDEDREGSTHVTDEESTRRSPDSDTSAGRHDNPRAGRISDW